MHRDLAREFDIEFESRDTGLIDHFSNTGSESHVLLDLKNALDAEVPSTVVSASTKGAGNPILYSGIAHSVGQNPLLIPVLHGVDTSYSGELAELDPDELDAQSSKKKKNTVLAGQSAGLISVFQTRENGRVGWIGSEDMLRDENWANAGYANAALVKDVTGWVLQETGVLKVMGTEHHRVADVEQEQEHPHTHIQKDVYRIKDDVTFAIDIAQHETTVNGSSKWGPFHANDIQLDFTMLDPHIRTSLHEVPSSSAASPGSHYETTFKTPDRHGVFKFVVNYWRPGYSFLHTSDKVSLVPFRHDEYPRFIKGAWPFYSSALSVSAVFIVFVAIWLATSKTTKDVKENRQKKKMQ